MKLAFLVFVLSLNSFAGIFPTKIERLSKKLFDRKLGVTTNVVIDPLAISSKDECIKNQLQRWVKEFKKDDNQTQEEVRTFFSLLKKVNLNNSVLTGKTANTTYTLRYERCYMNSYGGMTGNGFPRQDCDYTQKNIGFEITPFDGHMPNTRPTIINMELNFSSEFVNISTREIVFNTRSRKIFEEVNSSYADNFKVYVKAGRIQLIGDKTRESKSCDYKKLDDLLNMH